MESYNLTELIEEEIGRCKGETWWEFDCWVEGGEKITDFSFGKFCEYWALVWWYEDMLDAVKKGGVRKFL